MSFGIVVYDQNGVETLGMGDFTLQKLYSTVIPATNTGGQGVNTSYILLNVPGYNPATCFVTITPRYYNPNGQNGQTSLTGYLPTYKDLGGTQIGIYTYVNYRNPTGVGSDYVDRWQSGTVECTVEVVRVI